MYVKSFSLAILKIHMQGDLLVTIVSVKEKTTLFDQITTLCIITYIGEAFTIALFSFIR